MKFLDDFVDYHKDFTGCPETFVRWSGIYALSCAAGWGHVLRMGTWDPRPNLWILLCGDSSVKKSTALHTAESMITQIAPGIIAAQQYSEPALIADVAMEPHRCFFYDEAESFLKMLGEKYNQQMRSSLMSLYAGKVISRHIRGKEGKGETYETKKFDDDGCEQRPYICWGGASTPAQVGQHLNGSTTDLISGFFPRIILVPQTDKGYTIPRPPPHDFTKYCALRDRLAFLYAVKGREYFYSESAGKLFDDWHNRITRRIEAADAILQAFYLKLRDIFFHKVVILSAFERDSASIEDVDVENATQFLWLVEKGWADILAKFTEKEWDRETERVIRFIKERGNVSRSELLQGVKGVRAQKMTAILEGLKQDELIKVELDSAVSKPKTRISWL